MCIHISNFYLENKNIKNKHHIAHNYINKSNNNSLVLYSFNPNLPYRPKSTEFVHYFCPLSRTHFGSRTTCRAPL